MLLDAQPLSRVDGSRVFDSLFVAAILATLIVAMMWPAFRVWWDRHRARRLAGWVGSARVYLARREATRRAIERADVFDSAGRRARP